MKPISKVLRELAEARQSLRGGMTIYIVVDNHETDEEPHVQQHELSRRYLAQANDRRVIRHVMENRLHNVLSYIRGSTNESNDN